MPLFPINGFLDKSLEDNEKGRKRLAAPVYFYNISLFQRPIFTNFFKKQE